MTDLLSERPLSSHYQPVIAMYSRHEYLSGRRPPFTLAAAEAMLTDPKVQLGLATIRGAIIANARFEVLSQDATVKDFVENQLIRFWSNGIGTALRAMEFGWLGSEVLYREGEAGQVEYDRLLYLHPRDTHYVQDKHGGFHGLRLDLHQQEGGTKQIFVPHEKCFWAIHQADVNRWYGGSRLYGAYLPWYERWCRGGFRDQRFMWFFKASFRNSRCWFPVDAMEIDAQGNKISPRSQAQEILERERAGASVALPAYNEGQAQWRIEDPRSLSAPEGMQDYNIDLGDEIYEGLGIPPEVIHAPSGGAYAGRIIPRQAFMASLLSILQELIGQFDDQVIKTLKTCNGMATPHQIICKDLTRSEAEMEDKQAPGGGSEDPNNPQHRPNNNPRTFKAAKGGKTEVDGEP